MPWSTACSISSISTRSPSPRPSEATAFLHLSALHRPTRAICSPIASRWRCPKRRHRERAAALLLWTASPSAGRQLRLGLRATSRRRLPPALSALMGGEVWPVAMHISGPLLEWLENHAPGFVDEIGEHVNADRLELLTAGHDEPILAVLSRDDRLEQIGRHREHFSPALALTPAVSGSPSGCGSRRCLRILPKRACDLCWWTIATSASPDFQVDQLHARFVTESGGHRVNVFPIDEKLRYLVPFRRPTSWRRISAICAQVVPSSPFSAMTAKNSAAGPAPRSGSTTTAG